MKKLRSTTGLLLTIVMLLTLTMTGCTGTGSETTVTTASTKATTATTATTTQSTTASTTIDTSQHVKLKFYFLGEKGPDFDKVFTEINKRLTELVNAEIEPLFMSWGEYGDKYPLLFSSGEDFDSIFTCDWVFYAQTSAKGGFYELTKDLLDKYCPKTMENIPAAAWEGIKVNGKNYMIPNKAYFCPHYGVVVRGDLREKYGLSEIKTIGDVENFMDLVLTNEKDMIPLDISSYEGDKILRALVYFPQGYNTVSGDFLGNLAFKYDDPAVFDVRPEYEVPGFIDHLKRMAEWNKKGYLTKSDLTASSQQRFKAGKSAVVFDHIGVANAYYTQFKLEHPDWKVEYVDLLKGKKLPAPSFAGNGMGFNARSNNIERALMVSDLLGYDEQLNFLVCYGIPGVNAEVAGTKTIQGHTFKTIKQITPPEQVGDYTWWGWANEMTLPQDYFPGYDELAVRYFFDQVAYHPLIGATLVTDAIAAEVSATSSILKEYQPILLLGFAENPEVTLEEYIAKLKNAGIDKVNDEIKAQLKKIFDAAQ